MAEEMAYTCAVLTMSDKGSRGERQDTSGAYLQEVLAQNGYQLRSYGIVADRKEEIVSRLKDLADNLRVALVVTTGGTGLSPTDVTPQAMAEILDWEIPGLAEAMRAASIAKTPRGMLSRGKAGVRGRTLIVNLPGSLKAVRENFEVILPVLPHALEKIQGSDADCGIV